MNAEGFFRAFSQQFGGAAGANAAAQNLAAALNVDEDGWQIPPDGWGAAPAPGAREDAIARLPVVKVTAEDLAIETACLVCMEDLVEGEPCAKLPCGHFFHRECVVGWLRRHCTCPVCRLELPTADAEFERGRVARMRERKPRVRERELARKGVKELRELMRQVGVSWQGCLEKGDMVRRLHDSGRVDIVKDAPPEEMTHAQLHAMSVGALKRLMASLGVSAVDCFERADLVSALVASGRIVVVVDRVEGQHRRFTRAELDELTISDLRRVLCEVGKWSEADAHANDKGELIAALVASDAVEIVDGMGAAASGDAGAADAADATDVACAAPDAMDVDLKPTAAAPPQPLAGDMGGAPGESKADVD